MSIIREDFGSVSGGVSLNPSAQVFQVRNTSATASIDSSKHYILTIECKYAGTEDRTDVYYIKDGAIQTPALYDGTSSNYGTATISNGTLTMTNSSTNYDVFTLVTLD